MHTSYGLMEESKHYLKLYHLDLLLSSAAPRLSDNEKVMKPHWFSNFILKDHLDISFNEHRNYSITAHKQQDYYIRAVN